MKPTSPTARLTPQLLAPSFFDRPADQVARDLLGKALVRRIGRTRQALTVTETEAYLGPHDLACHAARGRTARTEIMFGGPGTLYVYFVYGIHWMLNIVTGPVGYPAAVLIRSAGELTGPGKLTKALSITQDLNGKRADCATGLWLEDRGGSSGRIMATPRIGVAYAGPIWARRKLRFVLLRRSERDTRLPQAEMVRKRTG
jgi:DNA-3-methyladenine glycosylase